MGVSWLLFDYLFYICTVICLYIILTNYGTYYTGITNSIIRRWHEHKEGKSSYLRKFTPKEVVYVEFYNDRKEAAKEERRVKNMGAFKYMNRLEHRQ